MSSSFFQDSSGRNIRMLPNQIEFRIKLCLVGITSLLSEIVIKSYKNVRGGRGGFVGGVGVIKIKKKNL